MLVQGRGGRLRAGGGGFVVPMRETAWIGTGFQTLLRPPSVPWTLTTSPGATGWSLRRRKLNLPESSDKMKSCDSTDVTVPVRQYSRRSYGLSRRARIKSVADAIVRLAPPCASPVAARARTRKRTADFNCTKTL